MSDDDHSQHSDDDRDGEDQTIIQQDELSPKIPVQIIQLDYIEEENHSHENVSKQG